MTIQSQLREEKEHRAQQLNREVQEATFRQIKAQVLADIEVLRQKLGSQTDQAVETATDLKYVRERQLTRGCFHASVLLSLSLHCCHFGSSSLPVSFFIDGLGAQCHFQ